MDSPGTWELLCVTSRRIASGTRLDRDQALRNLRRMGANSERIGWGGEAKNISDSVFGAGSRSALIVPMMLGNAARADPDEGSGAS
jgi:hypothetical protein